MPLVLADGQLAASSATILGAGTQERTVTLIVFNTSAAEQEINLKLTPLSGTARQFYRTKLKQYESLHFSGILMDPSNVLAGYASSASAVDYLVLNTPSAQLDILVRGADGSPKQSAEIEVTTTENFGLTRDGIVLSGLLEEIRDALVKIADGA